MNPEASRFWHEMASATPSVKMARSVEKEKKKGIGMIGRGIQVWKKEFWMVGRKKAMSGKGERIEEWEKKFCIEIK